MFRGASAITVDTKGRIAIPARYRHGLTESCHGHLIATIYPGQRCLLLYPLPEWENKERELAKLSDAHPQERKLKRMLVGHASECDMDKNGRFLIPSVLRDYAQLDKNVMLVGQFNKFEIWSDALWQEQVQKDLELDDDLNMSSERLMNLSL
jgi:MraZ protein